MSDTCRLSPSHPRSHGRCPSTLVWGCRSQGLKLCILGFCPILLFDAKPAPLTVACVSRRSVEAVGNRLAVATVPSLTEAKGPDSVALAAGCADCPAAPSAPASSSLSLAKYRRGHHPEADERRSPQPRRRSGGQRARSPISLSILTVPTSPSQWQNVA